jgi:hypothetical protein
MPRPTQAFQALEPRHCAEPLEDPVCLSEKTSELYCAIGDGSIGGYALEENVPRPR